MDEVASGNIEQVSRTAKKSVVAIERRGNQHSVPIERYRLTESVTASTVGSQEFVQQIASGNIEQVSRTAVTPIVIIKMRTNQRQIPIERYRFTELVTNSPVGSYEFALELKGASCG